MTRSSLPRIVLGLSALLMGCQFESKAPPPTAPVTISGQSYETVRIADRTWTAQSYSGPGGIPFRANEHIAEYGRYYTYEEAQAVSLPSGWRIPTLDDFRALALSQGVDLTNNPVTPQAAVGRLASKTRWLTIPGTNASGFNAYPGGYSLDSQDPLDRDIAEFWAQGPLTFSIQESASQGWHRVVFYGSPSAGDRFNLRFVRD